MKILIIGGGGREHALGWTLLNGKTPVSLFFAPGNPGMAVLGQRLDIADTDIEGLTLFAERESIELTVVGPEVPLSMGIVDRFRKAGLRIFGPDKAGARLEADKGYAKSLMQRANVPTAVHHFCDTAESAGRALDDFDRRFGAPFVIKENGLAAGKGVTIAANRAEANAAIDRAMAQPTPVVIEQFLTGQELSVLAICDGKIAIPMLAAQDFKKIGEGNTGPNTGGMGAYAPVPFVTPALMQQIQTTVLDPMMAVLKTDGIDYRGVLYAGLMIAPDTGAIQVIEFNARFGDPETQVVLPLLDSDLADILLCAADGDLEPYAASGFDFKAGQSAVTVVLASEGYPGAVVTGQPITLPEAPPPQSVVFHANTKVLPDQTLVTGGGRVLNATGIAETLDDARQHAYALADAITFTGKTLRRDIAALHPVRL